MGTPESIHGALLGIKELLSHSGTVGFFFFFHFFFPTYFLFSTCVKWQFLGNRYAEICEIVLKLREHKDALVRRSVIGLIPLLAQFDPTLFASNHLATCMNYLLSQLKKDKERPPGLLLFDLLI